MTNTWGVAVVLSDQESCLSVLRMLARQGVSTICVSTVHQFEGMLDSRQIDLVFCNDRLPDGSYRDILRVLDRSKKKMPQVVVMSTGMTGAEYDQAKHSGIFRIISTPCRQTDIEWTVAQAKRVEIFATKLLGIPAPSVVCSEP